MSVIEADWQQTSYASSRRPRVVTRLAPTVRAPSMRLRSESLTGPRGVGHRKTRSRPQQCSAAPLASRSQAYHRRPFAPHDQLIQPPALLSLGRCSRSGVPDHVGRPGIVVQTPQLEHNLSAAPPPSRRRDCARVEASERRFLDDQRGPEHRSCYTGPGSTGLVVGSVDHVRKRSSVVRMRAPQSRAEHRCGQDRVFPWPTRGVPSAIHSAASSTALAPSALADAPPVASSNWRTTSAASRPRSLTFRPCARAQFRMASLCASEPLLLTPPPEPTRLGARRRLAVALFAPPVRPRVPCPGPRAARCGRSL